MCDEFGNWVSDGPSRCIEETCGSPPALNNTKLIFHEHERPQTADYACLDGYEGENNRKASSTCRFGQWTQVR